MTTSASPPGSKSPPSDPTQPKRRSPSAGRIKESISGFVHRVKDVISPPTDNGLNRRGRSPDRRADYTTSTGRGGAGNMVSSKSRDRAAAAELKESAQGERLMRQQADRPRTHGRGGAGNIRSPSRDLETRAREELQLKQLEAEDRAIGANYDDRSRSDPISTGRGGAGNIIH